MPERSSRTRILLAPHAAPQADACWHPLADVYRTRGGWLLKFELAGVRKDDVSISLAGNEVTVTGVRRDWDLDEDCTCYSMEIPYSRFQRTIALPRLPQEAKLDVEFRDGLMLVYVTTSGGQR